MKFSIEAFEIIMLLFLPKLIYYLLKPKKLKVAKKFSKSLYIIERLLKYIFLFFILLYSEDVSIFQINYYTVILGVCILSYYYLWIKFLSSGFNFYKNSKRPSRNMFLLAFLPIVILLTSSLMFHNMHAFVLMVLYGIIHLINSYKM